MSRSPTGPQPCPAAGIDVCLGIVLIIAITIYVTIAVVVVVVMMIICGEVVVVYLILIIYGLSRQNVAKSVAKRTAPVLSNVQSRHDPAGRIAGRNMASSCARADRFLAGTA